MTWPLGSFIERFIGTALEVMAGRTYGHTGDATVDCVRAPYAMFKKLYGSTPIKAIAYELHLNGYPLGSTANAKALVDGGFAEFCYDGPARLIGGFPGLTPGVYYCQGWRGKKGHCFLVIVYPGPVNEPLWILEATNSDADMDADGVKDKYDWYRPVDWAAQLAKWDAVHVVRLLDPYTL